MLPQNDPQLELFTQPPQPVLQPAVLSQPPKVATGPSRTKVIEASLKSHLHPKTAVVWTDNKTTLLSLGTGKNKHHLRIHQMFMSANDDVIIAVSRYFKTGHPPSGQLIDAFIKSQNHLLMHHVKSLPLNTGKGQHHDLHHIQKALSKIYFNNKLELEVQWGRPEHRKRRRSILLGSYDPRTQRITIHPAIDQHFVPELCVARILHHEMCHHAYPAQKTASGRRQVHHRAFKNAESLFVGAMEADAWLDKHIRRILRSKPKK